MLRRHHIVLFGLLALVLSLPAPAPAATIELSWGIGSHHGLVVIQEGDTVRWVWSDALPHNVTATTGLFVSPILVGVGQTFEFTFPTAGLHPYFCGVHGAAAMDGTILVDSPISVEETSWGRVKQLYR